MRVMWQLSSTYPFSPPSPCMAFLSHFALPGPNSRPTLVPKSHDSHTHSFAGPGVYGHPLVRALLFVFPFFYSPLVFPSPFTCLPGTLASPWSSRPPPAYDNLVLPPRLLTHPPLTRPPFPHGPHSLLAVNSPYLSRPPLEPNRLSLFFHPPFFAHTLRIFIMPAALPVLLTSRLALPPCPALPCSRLAHPCDLALVRLTHPPNRRP